MPSHARSRAVSEDSPSNLIQTGRTQLFRSRGRRLFAAAGVGALGLVGALSAAGSASADYATAQRDWYRLRMCESTDNYSINTGNGYYGAYQFDLSTWRSVGGSGYPNNASPAEQDYRARLLYRARGWSPWACARILGLQPDPAAGYIAPRPTITSPRWAMAGTFITLRGTAAANSSVAVHMRSKVRGPFVAATVKATSSGTWSYRIGFARWAQFWAVAAGETSAATSTSRLYATTIHGPARVVEGRSYQVSGNSRPYRTVTLYARLYPYKSYYKVGTARTGALGNYVFVERIGRDLTYKVRGDVTSGTRTTRAQVTSSAPSRITRSKSTAATVRVTGWATPGSRVALHTRPYGQQWRVTRTVTTGASGAWAASFTGTYDTAYFAKDANGTASPSRWVLIRG